MYIIKTINFTRVHYQTVEPDKTITDKLLVFSKKLSRDAAVREVRKVEGAKLIPITVELTVTKARYRMKLEQFLEHSKKI